MTQESLARKFRPAGFDQPEGSRQSYTKPRRELQEAFYRWLDKLPSPLGVVSGEKYYEMAARTVDKFGDIPYKEANSLLVDFEPKTNTQMAAGLFVSACYKKSPESVIIFDVDAPRINFIGYKTDRDIFNIGRVYGNFGYSSTGVIVNNGDCYGYVARYSSGVAVNNGLCESLALNSCGLSVNGGEFSYPISLDFSMRMERMVSGFASDLKRSEIREYKKKRIVKKADIKSMQNLERHLVDLCEMSKLVADDESAGRFVERYGAGGCKIKEEIDSVLSENGWRSSLTYLIKRFFISLRREPDI